MKNIAIITTALLIGTQVLKAQVPPPPPPPPSTSATVYSQTASDSNRKNKNTNISISVSDSDDSYTIRAKFPEDRHQGLLDLLKKEMGTNNMTTTKGKQEWNLDSGKNEVYDISLSSNRLSLKLDKSIASSELIDKFSAMGKNIKMIISGRDDDTIREGQALQREADRMRREADRMRNEAERLIRNAERQEEKLRTQYEADAQRISNESRRIAQEAAEMHSRASQKGGVSAYVRGLLGENRTLYPDDIQNGNNWNWPQTQADLLAALKEDKLISTENEVNFRKDLSGIYVNGKKATSEQRNRYARLFSQQGISGDYVFTFYKSYNHIVLIDNEPHIEEVIEALIAKGLLSSVNENVSLEINGSSIYKDGQKVTPDQLANYNKILVDNHIIPAPGKTVIIKKKGTYGVGYQLSNRGHIGTWVVINK